MNSKINQQGPAFGYGPDGKIKPNAHAIRDLKGNTFFYSYQTLVAFTPANGIFAGVPIVRQNEWGTTTGKHLNWIDDGLSRSRVSAGMFERLYREEINGERD